MAVFDNLSGTHWTGRYCVFSSTGITHKYSCHQIPRIEFELLSISYKLNYKNCSTLRDKCENRKGCTEYRWGNWVKDMRCEGVAWMRVSQHGYRCTAVLSTIVNCRVQGRVRYVVNCSTAGFSKRYLSWRYLCLSSRYCVQSMRWAYQSALIVVFSQISAISLFKNVNFLVGLCRCCLVGS